MKNNIFIILLAVCVVGCVVPRNYPRAKWKVDKIVEKWPEVLQNDTIRKHDTTFVNGVEVDTIFKLSKRDTVIIEKERLKVRIIRGKRDTLLINAECLPDTIVKKIKIPVYTVDPENLRGGFNWWLVIIPILLTILGYIIYNKWLKKYK